MTLTASERQMSLQKRKAIMIRDYKVSIGCPCGERHPAVLDLHHRDASAKHPLLKKKNRQSGRRLLYQLGYDAIAAELEKCDVRCANCHRKLEWDLAHGVESEVNQPVVA
jgi:hypothetical protein